MSHSCDELIQIRCSNSRPEASLTDAAKLSVAGIEIYAFQIEVQAVEHQSICKLHVIAIDSNVGELSFHGPQRRILDVNAILPRRADGVGKRLANSALSRPIDDARARSTREDDCAERARGEHTRDNTRSCHAVRLP